MYPPVGKVRSGNEPDQLLELLAAGHRSRLLAGGEVRVLDDPDTPLDDLAKIVRWDVGRHAHGDAGRAVDQQVRKGRR